MSNYFLESFEHNKNYFSLKILNLKTDEIKYIKSKKVTLAAGAIGSSILLAKYFKTRQNIQIKHNLVYFFSFFYFNKKIFNVNERFVRLSNAEYRIKSDYFGDLFGQIYSGLILSNDILRNKFKIFSFLPNFLLDIIKNQICLSTISSNEDFTKTYMKVNKKMLKFFLKLILYQINKY